MENVPENKPYNPILGCYTGGVIHLLPPSPDEILAEDISHALSQLCRFSGQCTEFYSVAEHSIRVAAHVKPENRLAALLHDAAEAYLADVPAPVKDIIGGYKELEHDVRTIIYTKFGLKHDDCDWEDIDFWDKTMTAAEYRDLMTSWPRSKTSCVNHARTLLPPKTYLRSSKYLIICLRSGRVKQKIITCPSSIEIGSMDYSVHRSPKYNSMLDEHDWIGCHVSKTLELIVHADSRPADVVEEVLLHEIIHAISYVYGVGLDEGKVEAIAQGVHQVLKQLGIRIAVPLDKDRLRVV